MAYALETLDLSHVKDLESLWNIDVERNTLNEPLGDDLFDPPDEQVENAVLYGAFSNTRLVAAMKWGRRRPDAPVADLGNLLPGDGVIFWLFFTDEAGAEALLAQAISSQVKRLYAFPECGDLARHTLFETGMLSLRRKRLVTFLENHGFGVPTGDAWGPQERIGFHLSLPARDDIPPLPPGFHVEFKQTGASLHLLLHSESGALIGESDMGPARMNRVAIPRSFFLHWLGVDGAYRDRGFGRILLLTLLEHARQQGATDLYLTTHAGRPAWKLYQRIGFKEVDRLRSYALELN